MASVSVGKICNSQIHSYIGNMKSLQKRYATSSSQRTRAVRRGSLGLWQQMRENVEILTRRVAALETEQQALLGGGRKAASEPLAAAAALGAIAGKRMPASQVEDVLSRLARDSADVLGPPDQALSWLRSEPLSGVGGKTSAELIAAGLTHAVIDRLDELRFGGRG